MIIIIEFCSSSCFFLNFLFLLLYFCSGLHCPYLLHSLFPSFSLFLFSFICVTINVLYFDKISLLYVLCTFTFTSSHVFILYPLSKFLLNEYIVSCESIERKKSKTNKLYYCDTDVYVRTCSRSNEWKGSSGIYFTLLFYSNETWRFTLLGNIRWISNFLSPCPSLHLLEWCVLVLLVYIILIQYIHILCIRVGGICSTSPFFTLES